MHVRLKRKNQTIFLHVDPADNFFQLKTRVGEIHGMEPEKVQILGPDKVSLIYSLLVSYIPIRVIRFSPLCVTFVSHAEKGNAGHGHDIGSRDKE